MKCKFALKNLFNESVSVKVKQQIDMHVSQCPYCQGQVTSDNKVSDLLVHVTPIRRSRGFWQKILRDIRNYREERLKQRWLRLFDILPLEPAVRRTMLAGAVCGVALLLILAVYNPVSERNGQAEDESLADIEFYILEHSLAQDADLFSGATTSSVFMFTMELPRASNRN